MHRETIKNNNLLKKEWRELAEQIYDMRSNNHKSNIIHISRVFDENKTLLGGLVERCPTSESS